ncbi:MAG TPA: AAA family ATPase [Pyrinomonadaceae bacterium]|jgi:hypothetical protein|nr:AAA family ATPase [Pyrinomonadaceae bacterium]
MRKNLAVDSTSHTSQIEPDDDLMWTAGEFLRMEFLQPPVVLLGLYPGQIGQIIAEPNCFKTTLILNNLLSMACGRPSSPLYPGGSPLRVLYIDFESTGALLKEDLLRMLEAGGFTRAQRELIDYNFFVSVDVSIAGDMLDFSNPKHFEYALGDLKRHSGTSGLDVIVIDTQAEGFSLDSESDNSEVKRKIITPLKRLACQTGAAVLLAHHSGKQFIDERGFEHAVYRGRGATCMAAAVRFIVNLEHVKDRAGFVTRDFVKVRCAKVKGRPFPDTTLRYDPETRWLHPASVTAKPNGEMAADWNAAQYAEVLAVIGDVKPGVITRAKLLETLTLGRNRVDELLQRAMREGRVISPKRGHYRLAATVEPGGIIEPEGISSRRKSICNKQHDYFLPMRDSRNVPG